MIKPLKLSEKTVHRFKTFKKWEFSNIENNSILLEQGDKIPLCLDVDNKLSSEQSTSETGIKVRRGKQIKGTFFDKDSKYFNENIELLNHDGSYQRVIYDSVKHLFYNTYSVGIDEKTSKDVQKNPLLLFGSETGIYNNKKISDEILGYIDRSEVRVLDDEVLIIEIPNCIYGEKIKPESIEISNLNLKYDNLKISDDGFTNLMIGENSFNDVKRIISRKNSSEIYDDFDYFNYSDMSFGTSISSSEKYMLTGAPVEDTIPADIRTGRAFLYKKENDDGDLKLLKEFLCPFTQDGLASESQNDNTSFLLSELGNIITQSDITTSDNFGCDVEISLNTCAIGSSESSVTATNRSHPTGHVFVYDKNKGGSENWGLINILEGEPNSEFGKSISINKNYMVIGSPGKDSNCGGVYVYKKEKRKASNPWIRTSVVYESYENDKSHNKYNGLPDVDKKEYMRFLNKRDRIVGNRIKRNTTELKKLLDSGKITETEYHERLTTYKDYSQTYPFYPLYTSDLNPESDIGYLNGNKIWSKFTNNHAKFKDVDDVKFYQRSVYPGYTTEELSGCFIPNPEHQQNKTNLNVARWKIESVIGNHTPLLSMGMQDELVLDDHTLNCFGGSAIHSFGDDSGYPMNEYTKSPRTSHGDVTWELIGFIKPPSQKANYFGENVKITDRFIYVTNPSSHIPSCFVFEKLENKDEWKQTHSLSKNEINKFGVNSPKISKEFSEVSLEIYDNYIDLGISPSTNNYSGWAYSIDQNLISNAEFDNLGENLQNLVSGEILSKCDTQQTLNQNYLYFTRYNKLNKLEVAHLQANSGTSVLLKDVIPNNLVTPNIEPRFFSKPIERDSFYRENFKSEEPQRITWKNFRENVSFAFPNVTNGNSPSFMTIYYNGARNNSGEYDPIYTIGEIGATETLNGNLVRLIFDTGYERKNEESFIEFEFYGTPEGSHFTLSELTRKKDYDCLLKSNLGYFVDIIAPNFKDPIGSKKPVFYSCEDNNPYKEAWSHDDDIEIYWKNLREGVAFAYPRVKLGKEFCLMKIYFDEAKMIDGTIDTAYTIAEIEATETLNGQQVRLIFNYGSESEDSYYYDFIFIGSPSGTHFTLSELKSNMEFDYILPPNLGTMKDISKLMQNKKDLINNNENARFFSKHKNELSFVANELNSNEMGLSWKNLREGVSFSYPKCESGVKPAFMTIYSDNAKQINGSYDPIYTLAEIGAHDTLNGKQVRLTLNTGSPKQRKELNFDFVFIGSMSGTHFTLSELRKDFDPNYTELPQNKGEFKKIKSRCGYERLTKSGCPSFFTKGETELSYTDEYSGQNAMAISWKNFRENVSFQYPRIESGNMPSFMTIYSNGGKKEDGTYDPLYTIAEIGAQETLNGHLVKLIINGSIGKTPTYFYEFLFRGTIEGSHYTINELTKKLDYECTLGPNLGSFVDISGTLTNDFLRNENNAKLFSKKESDSSYIESWGHHDDIALSWKNFRENVSFSYPRIKSGNLPSFMTIYSDNAKKSDGTYDPLYTLAEVGASDTLNGEQVRLTLNCGTLNEYYYDFIFRGTIEGTHYTLSELITQLDFTCNLEPNEGNCEDISHIDFDDFLKNKENAKFYSKPLNQPSYLEPYSSADKLKISWKNFRENVMFSYPNKKETDTPSIVRIFSNNGKTENGTYDEIHTIAEIQTTSALNGETVRLTLNRGKIKEFYIEFVYNGTESGVNYTLNELSRQSDFDLTLKENQGTFEPINKQNFQDYLNGENPRFYRKTSNDDYIQNQADATDYVEVSWNYLRENISFSYNKVELGTDNVIMNIYSDNAIKNEQYDKKYMLASIIAQDTLNNKSVRLTFNTGQYNEFFLDFEYFGDDCGTDFTISELLLGKKTESVIRGKKLEYSNDIILVEKNFRPQRIRSQKIQKTFLEKVNPVEVCPIEYKKSYTLKKKKSHTSTKPNQGVKQKLNECIIDDFLQNDGYAEFYTMKRSEFNYDTLGSFKQIRFRYENLRENIKLTYPLIDKLDSNEKLVSMSVYAKNGKTKNGEYLKNYILCKIISDESLIGETIRMTFNVDTSDKEKKEFFYEFIFDGLVDEQKYTLDELEEVSPNLGIPLIVKSPTRENCSVRLKKEDLTSGKHKLFVGLVDDTGSLVGEQSELEFICNPSLIENQPRHTHVKDRYRYNYDIKSKFGTAIDANNEYLVIGDSFDREFKTNNSENTYRDGTAYVFKNNEGSFDFFKKIYKNDDKEELFNSEFGTSVAILNNTLVVGGHSLEMSSISMDETDHGIKLTSNDYNEGVVNLNDDFYSHPEILITNFEYSFDSEYGDLEIKIDISTLNIDITKIKDCELRADFIDTGDESIRIKNFKGNYASEANGEYSRSKPRIVLSRNCEINKIGNSPTFLNKNNYSVYYSTHRKHWILSETRFSSIELTEPTEWFEALRKYEAIYNIYNNQSLSSSKLNQIKSIYNVRLDEISTDELLKFNTRITSELLNKIRIDYYADITDTNLNLLQKILGFDDDVKIFWNQRVKKGYLVCDVFNYVSNKTPINFIISNCDNENEIPDGFDNGFGKFENQTSSVIEKCDTTGVTGFLNKGVYRQHTKVNENEIFFYVNKKNKKMISKTLVFLYYSKKNAVQGYVNYYQINEDNVNKLKTIKTKKEKYSVKKQYGKSVALSSEFIYVGMPICGNFNLNEIVTFSGSDITTFKSVSKIYTEHICIDNNNLQSMKDKFSGEVIAYDHKSLTNKSNKFVGNAFYKNGIIVLTNNSQYFKNILTNIDKNNFQLKFKGSQTIYENEIICRVEPHEFNYSTNPTSVKQTPIPFDINEDGKFDITDLIIIYKYITESLNLNIDIDETKLPLIEVENTTDNTEYILTESEDLLLIDLINNNESDFVEQYGEVKYDKMLEKLDSLYQAGLLDINNDGKTDALDARLLVRYFLGITGKKLFENVVATTHRNFDSYKIINSLNENTGKKHGTEILDEFNNYKENDTNDKLGSYLAPYATTIGLYSGLDLVMIAKLGKPIKILPNYPINFLVKYDT